MTEIVTGSASVDIARPPGEVAAAVSDITRMGEWSPENTGGRWIAGDGPAVGATFQGDNVAKAGPITLKRWSTVSEVTAHEPGSVFEFVVEDTTTWRFEFVETDVGTRVTESFAYPQYTGFQKILYNLAGSRRTAMVRGVEQTLARLKAALEN